MTIDGSLEEIAFDQIAIDLRFLVKGDHDTRLALLHIVIERRDYE